MDVSCVIIELKIGSKARVEEWAHFIISNREEAFSTLKNEGVSVESFFFSTIEEKDSLIGYMRAKSIEHGHAVVKKSLSTVDAYHQNFKKAAWGKCIGSDLVLDLSRIKNEESIA